MSRMHFGLEISATDRTQGGLRSALSSVTGFARGAMGALRDFNLGVRPIVAGLDRIIERGSELEVVRKAFESLTGKRGAGADLLARRLVNASSGTLRLAEAMQIANRALSSGMKFEQLATAIEFIGKKSIATGKDAREALNTVITGLSRGSTLFLDDFGILVDGIDGVRARFDKMKGKGAFDALGPAAQKAETVSQAIAEMSQQMGRLGVSGRETVFLLAGMKNAIGDMVDRLVLSVAKSKALKEFLGNARDLLRGIGQHFDKGGTFGELLMPALNVAKTFFIDLGKTIGHGIAGALLKGMSGLVGFLDQAIDFVTDKFDNWIETLGDKIKDVVPKPILDLANWLNGKSGADAAGEPKGNAPRGLPEIRKEEVFPGIWKLQVQPGPQARAMLPMNPALALAQIQVAGAMGAVPQLLQNRHVPIGQAVPAVPQILQNRHVPIGQRPPAGNQLARLQQWLDDAAAGQFAQTGFGDTAKAASDFYGRFSSKDTERDRGVRRAAALRAAQGTVGLTGFARRNILTDIARAEHDMAVIQRGGGGARQAGLAAAAEEIDTLRRGGFAVTPSVRRRIIDKHLQDARNNRIRPLRERVERDRELLDADDAARRVKGVAGAVKANAANRAAGDENAQRKRDNDDRLVTLLEALNAKVTELKTALVGEGGRIAKAR